MGLNQRGVLRGAVLSMALAGLAVAVPPAVAASPLPVTPAAQQGSAPRSKQGKRLFSTLDAIRVARVRSPRLSPDGARVAYLVSSAEMPKDKPWKEVTHLWVAPSAGPASAARQYTRGDESVSDAAWSPDGKIIAFTMQGEKKPEGPQVWFIYADGGEPWQVTHHEGGVREFEFAPGGKTLLLVAGKAEAKAEEQRKMDHDDAVVVDHDFRLAQLWTWDIASGHENQITHGDFAAGDARFSPDGSQITFTSIPTPRLDDRSLTTVWLLDVSSGHLRKLAESPAHTSSARWSPDGKSIVFLGSDGGPISPMNLYVEAAGGGVPRRLGATFPLLPGDNGVGLGPVWSADGKTIFFNHNTGESVEVFAADVASGTIRQVSERPGIVAIDEIAKNGAVIGTFTDPTHPAEVFRSDAGFRSIRTITDQNPWLADYALGQMEVIRWKSSKDGMEIEGIVTKPVDFESGHKYPFLLNPHGGPTAASLLMFNPTEQIMAANGYMVLQPNFRGSTGRGLKFADANQHDWGDGDYRDDMSGVDAAIARGWADPNRLGAFGWSYGGFMTYWIDTQTDRFKAISPGAGLPDLYSMYSQTDIHRYLRVFFGGKSPWDDFDEYWAHSPMKYIENVKTPTMILHGQADTRVPMPQAKEFYQALSERHVPVEFVQYPRENHGFVEPRHIQDRWQRYLVFFGKYLDNPPVTEPAATIERMQKYLPH
jgi:dipeptidyl aminopeptidase/acylaminoacyl peptidase